MAISCLVERAANDDGPANSHQRPSFVDTGNIWVKRVGWGRSEYRSPAPEDGRAEQIVSTTRLRHRDRQRSTFPTRRRLAVVLCHLVIGTLAAVSYVR